MQFDQMFLLQLSWTNETFPLFDIWHEFHVLILVIVYSNVGQSKTAITITVPIQFNGIFILNSHANDKNDKIYFYSQLDHKQLQLDIEYKEFSIHFGFDLQHAPFLYFPS